MQGVTRTPAREAKSRLRSIIGSRAYRYVEKVYCCGLGLRKQRRTAEGGRLPWSVGAPVARGSSTRRFHGQESDRGVDQIEGGSRARTPSGPRAWLMGSIVALAAVLAWVFPSCRRRHGPCSPKASLGGSSGHTVWAVSFRNGRGRTCTGTDSQADCERLGAEW